VSSPVIVAYQARWRQEFAEIRDRLAGSFGDLASHIEHIGSTSIPGLPAKDVIDVQVSVAALEPEEPILRALVGAGMTDVVEERPVWDHVPPGWEGPVEQWTKLFASPSPGERRVHVHVRVFGSPNERFALLFRDFMRAHPDARDAWAIFKRELARISPTIQDYVEVKDPATDVVMVVAERWADETGWTPHAGHPPAV
jgi:GrpB-like predicted nucleotidyltransferase (UPF0157 family)